LAQCKRHPSVETNLSCNKCGDPICPRCMVQTPVGARCPVCANLKRVPTYQLGGKYYLRGALAAAGMALAGGFLWWLIRMFVPFSGFFNFIIAGALGYGIGEGISLATNRKAGGPLAVMGGLAVAVAFFIAHIGIWMGMFHPFDLIALIVGIIAAVAVLR
jgi:hypothetical protein